MSTCRIPRRGRGGRRKPPVGRCTSRRQAPDRSISSGRCSKRRSISSRISGIACGRCCGMAEAVDDIATYLAAYSPSLSLTVGTNLFRFALQPSPDEQTALIPYDGLDPEGGFGKDGIRWEYPRLQVVCRGA